MPFDFTVEDHETHRLLCEVIELLRHILHRLPQHPKSATGELMPATISVGGNGATFTFKEWSGPNGSGHELPPAGPVSYTSDTPAVATVDASGQVTAVAAGNATITGTDSANGLSASDMLTVSPEVAVSATGVLTANP